MAKGKQTIESADEQARAWFVEHGWRLQPDELRAALTERGSSVDLVVERAGHLRAVVRDSLAGAS